MDFSVIVERVERLCLEKGMDKRIYTKSGAGKDFISNIKKGSAPSVEKVFAVANHIDCSVDYLLGRTNNPASHMDSGEMAGLNSEEKRLIEGYRELNDEGKKQAVIYVTEFLMQNIRFTQKSDSHDIKEA